MLRLTAWPTVTLPASENHRPWPVATYTVTHAGDSGTAEY